jgi:hypothetical protein
LKVHKVSDVRHEPLVPYPICFEVEIAIAMLKIYKLPDSDQIPAEEIQAGGETIQFINILIAFGIRKNCLSADWKECLTEPFYKKGD